MRRGGGQSELAMADAKGENRGGAMRLTDGKNEGGWATTDKRSVNRQCSMERIQLGQCWRTSVRATPWWWPMVHAHCRRG
jgi:hypothetical protein